MAEWDRDTPWRQGNLLGSDAIDALKLRHPEFQEKTLVVVATHDCDLAQHPDAEPRIEVVVGRLTEKDGTYVHAKSVRRLHIVFSGAGSFWVEFDAIAKVSVAKTDLAPYSPRPDAHLTPESHATFQMWLASRYRRSAFPDEFERRLTRDTKLAERIAKAVKPHGDLIAGVFFDVDDGAEVTRDGAADTYTLDITILHTAEPDFLAAEKAATHVAKAIETAFREKLFAPTKMWQHIELRSCEPVSESVMSYLQFKRLKRWRLDHISLAADPQQSVLAE